MRIVNIDGRTYFQVSPALLVAGCAIYFTFGALGMPIAHRVTGGEEVVCGFYERNQRPCPGCGATRSLHAFTRGNLRESWHHHGVVWTTSWLMLVALGVSVWGRIRRRDVIHLPVRGLAALGIGLPLWLILSWAMAR